MPKSLALHYERLKKFKEMNESKAKMLLYTKDDDEYVRGWALMKLRNYKDMDRLL
jgi:hypothetical protein